MGGGITMNASSFGAVAQDRTGAVSDELTPDKSLDAAWNVLEPPTISATMSPSRPVGGSSMRA